MSEQRLQTLIRRIEAGELSKNKHFEAYEDPLVREAKQRQVRLRAIRQILERAEADAWQVDVTRLSGDRWQLDCRSDRWNLAWNATLEAFEMALLRETPAVRQFLDEILTGEMSLSAV